MKKDLKQKDLFIPLPVLIIGTYDKDGVPNVMNAAWGTLHDYGEVFLCLSSNHKTTENIKLNKEFTISFATKETVAESDYFGLVSGYKENKIKKASYHAYKSSNINAPLFDEYPLTLECKIKVINDDGQTAYLVGEIVNVVADEKILTNGKVDISKLNPIIYNSATNTYNLVGEKVVDAFNVGKKVINEKN